jgi:excisionase family DNA binding protein
MVDLREASKVLKIDPMKLFKMVRSGEVPGALMNGRSWSIDLEELESFLQQNLRRPK